MPKEIRVAIVGAGASGICSAIQLRKKLGLESFTIYEKSGNAAFGGTWDANIYPGCACDVPSHWYSLSTELNPDWSEVYSSQGEIKRYWDRVSARHGLEKKTEFNTMFISAVWSEEDQLYRIKFRRVETNEEFTVEAEVFISAMGGLSIPLVNPVGMKGVDSFEGDLFHSARWRYDIPLAGKKVAVIGNGCSASQFVPIIAEDSSTEVMNFVRTPNYYMPRPQAKYSAATKWTFRHVPGVMRSYRAFIAASSDIRAIVWKLSWAPLRHYVEEVSIAHIKSQSPEKYHAFLTPRYPFGCKRVIMDPGYLASLHRSNVDMITDPIDSITPKGLRGKSGKEYEFDVLIMATGFEVGSGEQGADIRGRDGKTLSQQWKAQGGAQAYLGTTMANFPNFYTLLGPNVASGVASAIYAIEGQVQLMVQLIEPLVKNGVTSMECKVDAETTYNQELQARCKKTVWAGGCVSWYSVKTASGESKNVAGYPGLVTELVWKSRKPVWENYIQIGGNKRLAASHRVSQIVKGLALLTLVFALHRFGLENVKAATLLFLLSRAQEIQTLVASLRA